MSDERNDARGGAGVELLRGKALHRHHIALCAVCKIPTDGARLCHRCSAWLDAGRAIAIAAKRLREAK